MLCFEKFPVTNKFMDERVGEGGNGVSHFSVKKICLTVPNYFVEEPFRVSLISGVEKFYASEGYVTIFCRNFLSHSAEKLCSGTLLFCVSESFRYRKKLPIRERRKYEDCPSENFGLTLPKTFVRNLSRCH